MSGQQIESSLARRNSSDQESSTDLWSGIGHPFAIKGLEYKGASEVVTSTDGATTLKPLDKLDPGDHTVELLNGRQFLIHIPKAPASEQLPVMFVFSGSAEPQWNIKDFATESGMSKVADQDPQHPFVVVYPLAEKHDIGVYSKQPAFAWNSSGSLIDDQDRRAGGYDDIDYVKQVRDLIPHLANVDYQHRDWGALAFSQGGPFLNHVVSTLPELFPSVDLVGSTMQKDFNYQIQAGNAQNVEIVELLGDKSTLPMRGLLSQNWEFDRDTILRFVLHDVNIGDFHGKSIIEQGDPLAPIHNENQNPLLQNELYLGRLGEAGKDYNETKFTLSTPVEKTKKDFELDYRPLNAADLRRVTVFGLIEAMHSYPAPLYGPRTNAQPKYTQFDASSQFAKDFDAYNDQVHKQLGE